MRNWHQRTTRDKAGVISLQAVMTKKRTQKTRDESRSEKTSPSTDIALSVQHPLMIVGIGASAGGYEAFKELLEALPPAPGMAFIFIQHLEPTHESMLVNLLGRATPIPVVEARDGVRVETDRVYVVPPNTNLVILNGTLNLQTITETASRHKTIDFFFRSLAADQESRAVGVLLSGTGSDGVMGLKAIKAEGGITLVQDEKTAKFGSMPRSAVMAGVADFVLSPEDIAKELIKVKDHYPRLVMHPAMAADEPKFVEENDELRKILVLVWTVSQVDFSAYKPSTLRRRIFRRMALHKLDKLAHYVRYLEQNSTEVKALYQDLVICVTSFFRDPEVFEALKSEIFPQILENKSANFPLRVWVPGCSTGEEVYSLAISLLECLGERAANVPIQIFGTDISEAAVDKARTGIYPESIEADVSPERLRRFFIKGEAGYQISKPIRDLCVFARQNVFKDPPFSNLDLISCRNVLIYFGPELQKKVLPMFHYILNPNGFLLLGNSESIGAFADLFAPAHKRHKIYSKKSVSPRMILDLTRGEYGMEKQGIMPSMHEGLPKPFDPLKESDRLLLERYSPPGVLINGDMNILQFRGRTGLFIEPAPGGASFNLLRMAREGLMIPLHTAIREANERSVTIRKEDVLFKGNSENYRVDVEVIPISNPTGAKEKFFLVLFQNAKPADGPQNYRASESQDEAARKPRESEQNEEYERLKRNWRRPRNTCNPSSNRRRPSTRNCARPTGRSCSATRNCRAPTRNWRPPRRNCSRPTRN